MTEMFEFRMIEEGGGGDGLWILVDQDLGQSLGSGSATIRLAKPTTIFDQWGGTYSHFPFFFFFLKK
jgi:hypothetical protein